MQVNFPFGITSNDTYYYAVHCGRYPGVYNSWFDCHAQVTNYSGAIFQRFRSSKDAIDYVTNGPKTKNDCIKLFSFTITSNNKNKDI